MKTNSQQYFLFTVDVEDWFQVENFKSEISLDSWGKRELRVECNTHRILDLLDEACKGSIRPNAQHRPSDIEDRMKDEIWEEGDGSGEQGTGIGRQEGFHSPPFTQNNVARAPHSQPQTASTQPTNKPNKPDQPNELKKNRVCATFFVLGWIARKLPNLVREIRDRGHEVASHGINHRLCTDESIDGLRRELADSKALLEDIIGDRIVGYRAPSFSVNNDILKIIEDAGYQYDASYNSFDRHGRYGRLNTSGFHKSGIAYKVTDDFYELPVSNLSIQNSKFKINNLIFPWGGGGYFRLVPYTIFKKGIRHILAHDGAYSFYLHPWEADPDQPRVDNAPRLLKFRHYVNLSSTAGKIRRMLHDFKDCTFVTCREYVEAAANDRMNIECPTANSEWEKIDNRHMIWKTDSLNIRSEL